MITITIDQKQVTLLFKGMVLSTRPATNENIEKQKQLRILINKHIKDDKRSIV